jgi:hypothetical protein
MKRIILAIASILGLSACEAGLFGEVGNGVSMTQEIEVGDFDRISIPSFVDVYYTQTSDQQSVSLTCDENLTEYYKIHVRDGELIVDCKRSFYNKIDTYVTVCSPVLNGVKLSGSGDLYIDEAVKAEDIFTLEVNGSGDADIAGITAGSVTTSLSGSGDVEIEKIEAESATFRSSGSGDIEVDNLTAESINVATTGSGDCTLRCKDSGTLNIQLSGSGDITVSGTARAIVNISTTGSGDFNMNRLTLSGK